MKIGDYEIDIVVQGFPGKSVCHGGLGWSTVVLLRAHGRLALIDTGNMSMRTMLIKRFADRGVRPADITDLLLTHSHHDHSANWTMFPKARIVIGADELVVDGAVGRDAGARTIHAGAEHLADLAQSGGRRGSVSRHHRASRARPYAGPSGVRDAHSRARRDLHRRCRQEPRRAGVGDHRPDL